MSGSGVNLGKYENEKQFSPTAIAVAPDGAVYLKARQPLGPYPVRLTDCLDRWAAEGLVSFVGRDVTREDLLERERQEQRQ